MKWLIERVDTYITGWEEKTASCHDFRNSVLVLAICKLQKFEPQLTILILSAPNSLCDPIYQL